MFFSSKLSNNNNHPAMMSPTELTPEPDSATINSTPPPSDTLLSPNFYAPYDALADLCRNNCAHFAAHEPHSELGRRMHAAFAALQQHLAEVRPRVERIRRYAHEYDFDPQTPGNGYRSFLLAMRSCVSHALRISSAVMQSRSSLLFRRHHHVKEAEAAGQLMASLGTCLGHLETLREWSSPGSLFPGGTHTAAELFDRARSIDQYSFYGRCLGYQFGDSMRSALRIVAVAMAGFSEVYYSQGSTFERAAASAWTSGKYWTDPELRARRIVDISRNAQIDFCKSFWLLNEMEWMSALPSVMGTSVAVNRMVEIGVEEVLRLPSTVDENRLIEIPVPSSHGPTRAISARLISARTRRGMPGCPADGQPAARGLIVHCHGGGFVAQSSKSHEMYLRDWAVALDVPILSIDYSLAPEAPFPRATEEVFFAYCWALEHCVGLGTTGERVVLAGDSAGANLNLSIALNCIRHGVRMPDGIFLAYCPVRISFDPTPARLLCLMDPLLPFGFMMRCLKAYACPNATIVAQKDEEQAAETDVSRCSSMQTVQLDVPQSPQLLTIAPSQSMDGASSLWEHIDGDFDRKADQLRHAAATPTSDDGSDTFASASLRSRSSAGDGNNTEMLTPDESIGESSLEEDSQPITLHRPLPTTSDSPTKADEEKAPIVPDPVVVAAIPVARPSSGILAVQSTTALSVQNIQRTIIRVVDCVTQSVANRLNAMTASAPIRDCTDFVGMRAEESLDAVQARNPSDELLFQLPRDPLLSPYFADDETLRRMPRTHFVSVDMDPCLDDCVMYAKRLKALGREVSMDILAGLPHGFLNFVKTSKEAHAANKICVLRIQSLLDGKDDAKIE